MSRCFLLYRHFDGASGLPPEKRMLDNASSATLTDEGTNEFVETEFVSKEYASPLESNGTRESSTPLPDSDASKEQEQLSTTWDRVFGPEPPASSMTNVLSDARSTRRSGLAITSMLLAIIVIVGAVASIANLSGHFGMSTFQPGHPTAAFHPAPCTFQLGAGIVEGRQVRCGYITVPENRNARHSHMIKLAVAIFKSKHFMTSVDPNPVLRLDGGPGGVSLDTVGNMITSTNYNAKVFNHDLILFDQRGVGHSTPSLDCKQGEALRACHDRLVASGIDLNGYNTLQNAADVADIVHALGYKQMTLYGVSYGTRLALTVMRLHPEVVRAAVLDSVYPTNHTAIDVPFSMQRAFETLFQGCAKDPDCNAKYPHLQEAFYQMVDQFNAHPISLKVTDPATQKQQVIQFSGNDLVTVLFKLLYVTRFIPELPQLIDQIHQHDYTTLSAVTGAVIQGASSTSGMGNVSSTSGMGISTECSEDMPFMSQQDFIKRQQSLRPAISTAFRESLQSMREECRIWNVQTVPASQKQPVTSDIPTLVLSGEYDPITPPSNGQEAAKKLSHSYSYLFPGQGHGQEFSSPCSNLLISEFEDSPYQRPADACTSQMTPPLFQ